MFRRCSQEQRLDVDGRKVKPRATDKVFPAYHKKQLNRILEKSDLKFDPMASGAPLIACTTPISA